MSRPELSGRPHSPPADPWSAAEGFYRDRRLASAGIPHGVTLRRLGDMKDPGRRAAALSAAGLARRFPMELRQVHGTAVWEAVAGRAERPEGDGWVCADRSVAPCVYVADCLPLFLWDKSGSVVGVFHAGWRGLAAGMPRSAVRAFRRHGVGPGRLAASVGPHIGPCCYAVGPEVARRFRAGALHGGRLDLGEEARLQLTESGVAPEDVAVSGACTACRGEELVSYRKEKLDFRMMAFVALGDAS